jgi:hypothetical protein
MTAMEYISHMEDEPQKVVIDFIQEKDNEIEDLKEELKKAQRQFKMAQRDAMLIKDTFKENIVQEIKKEIIKGLKEDKKIYNKELKNKREKKIVYKNESVMDAYHLFNIIRNKEWEDFTKNIGIYKNGKKTSNKFLENMLEFMGDAVESDHDVEDFIENGETGTMITIKYNINEEIYEIGAIINENEETWISRKQNVYVNIKKDKIIQYIQEDSDDD